MQHVPRILLVATLVAAAACEGRGGRSETETGAIDTTTAAAPAAPEEFKVANVMIGKRIGANNLITEPTFQFAPADTVYVSVGTTGKSDSTTLAAVWHYQDGKMVDSSAKTIHPGGPENNEFHVAARKGWKPGTYKVTIFSNGDSVDAKAFAVKKQAR
jgi:hypothetical protein